MWWPLQGGPRTQLVADCTYGRDHLDWKRGEVVPRSKVAITLETKPGNKPGTNKLESRLGTGARPQGTATCRPHASISKLAHSRGLTPTAADPDIKTHLLEAARIALQWVHLVPTEGVDYLASSHLIGLPKSEFSMSQLIF